MRGDLELRWWYWAFNLYDACALSFAAVAALLIRHDFSFTQTDFASLIPYVLTVFAVSFITFLVVRADRSLWRYASLANLAAIVLQVTLIITIALVIDFVLFRLESIPRSVPFIQAFLGIGAIGAPRLFIRIMGRQHRSTNVASKPTNLREHVLVVGLSSVTDLYLRCVEELGKGRFVIEGILTEADAAQGRALRDTPILGEPADLPLILDGLRVHGVEISRIVLAVPFASLSEAAQRELRHWESHGPAILDLFEERLGFREPATIGDGAVGTPAPEARIAQKPGPTPAMAPVKAWADLEAPPTEFPRGFFTLKRAYDVIAAVILMIALLPFYALGALLVLIDLGTPIVFWQVRPGLHRTPIRVHKLRTMGTAHDRTGRRLSDEERISWVGRFLRRGRLDELPQLYDVLVGHLSLVGPRPLLPKDMPHNVEWRYQVRPGITGWAQVNGGHLLTPGQKLILDRYYIENASILFDIKILVLTLIAAFRGDKINRAAIAEAERTFGVKQTGHDQGGAFSAAKGAGE